MLPMLVLNLACAVIFVSGWSLAVWTLYNRLGDPHPYPYAPQEDRLSCADSLPRADHAREALLSGNRA